MVIKDTLKNPSRRVVICLGAMMVALNLTSPSSTHCQDVAETPDSARVQGVVDLGVVPAEQSLEAMRDVVKEDPQDAEAWYRLGSLLMNRGPEARQEADRCLRKAIALEPENMDYQIGLGGLLFAKGFFFNAAEHFEKLEAEDPSNARAAYWIGYYALGEYLHEKDLRGGETPLKKLWADADMDKAVTYLKKSIDADPQFKDSYYQLGLLALENGRPEGLLDVARDLLDVFPTDKDALLFCGLAYTSMSSFTKADSCFTLALSSMSPEERSVIESVELLTPEQTDTTAFWTESDPLYLSDYNERRMEHYSRVAYANLRFSVVWKQVEGWRTDLGKSYIRFGRYGSRRTSVGAGGEWREQWSYESFSLLFKNPWGVADWSTFAFAPAARKTFGGTDARYLDPYRSVRYHLPGQGVVHKRSNGGRLSFSFALPVDKLVSASDGILLDEGIFVFDENWRPLLTMKQPVVLLPPDGSGESDTRYLLSERTLTLPEGATHLVVEIADKTGKSIGSLRQDLNGQFDDGLRATKPLFAFSIEVSDSDLRTIEDLTISPNPLRTYSQGAQIQVAFEIYNLQRNSFGRTLYEVAYEVGPSETSESIDHFRSLSVPSAPQRDAGGITRVKADYVGDRGDDVTYLSIDPGLLSEGVYFLKLVVRDKVSSDSVTVVSEFGILQALPVTKDLDSDYSVLTSVPEDVSPGEAKEAITRLREGKAAYHEFVDTRERPVLVSGYRSDFKVIDDPRKPIKLLKKAISLNPELKEAYYYLALTELEKGDPAAALKICRALLGRDSTDTHALLLAGLAAESKGELADAAAWDSMAVSNMRIEEQRAIYGSVDLLAQKSKLVDALASRSSDTWVRSPEWTDFWNRFWKPRDPLFLTTFNERLVTHLGRFVYADLRFRQEGGQRGAFHDYGRAWIKFGRYASRSSSHSQSTYWNYGNFNLAFSKTIRRDGGPTSVRIDELSLQKYPSRYADPYAGRKYSMPFQIAAFREADSMRVELSYATLRQALKGKRGNYRFTQGVFAFDRGWRPLLDDVRDVDLKWRRKSKDRASNDRGDHLVGVQTLTVAPGTYHFAVEVADLIGDGISVFRSTASLGGGEDLAVSDLLLASKITPRGDVVTSREDLIISPNPIRYYTPKTPIHVYFEIYNLVKDDFGRTRYRLAYELAKPKGRLDPARFAVLDDSQRLRFEKDLSQTLSTTGDQTRRVEAEYEGETPDDFTYLEIDVSQIPRGIYALNIEVEDLTSGQTSRKGTVLRVDR